VDEVEAYIRQFPNSRNVRTDNGPETFQFKTGACVLYTYREDDFSCPNGKPESGSILEALYAKGKFSAVVLLGRPIPFPPLPTSSL
jgi:hypothetical protein